MDIYSRKIVGWQVYQNESSAQAADLMTDICHREGVKPNQVTPALRQWKSNERSYNAGDITGAGDYAFI